MRSRALAAITALAALLLLVSNGTQAGSARAAVSDGRFVTVSIDSVTPATVTGHTSNTVTLSGTLRNVGDRNVKDVSVRAQRAPAVTTNAGLREDLAQDRAAYDVDTPFIQVRSQLKPGESARFTLRVPLNDASGSPSFQITRPGVYPILVNANGTPDYGGPAVLDDSRTLLPVLAIPADSAGSSPRLARMGDDSVTAHPVHMTILWPLAEKPRIAAGVPGGGRVRLIDDSLAQSLSTGRLKGLLDTAASALADRETRNDVGKSMCVAIDPDLLITVRAMTGDYLVSDDPKNPTGPAHNGSGSAAASAWLSELKDLASHSCTVALPFAGADLDAIAGQDAKTQATVVNKPADIVDSILQTQSVRGVIIPASRSLTAAGASMLHANKIPTTLLASTAISTPAPLFRINDELTGSVLDAGVAGSLAAMGTNPVNPLYSHVNGYDLDAESVGARDQAGVASLAWRALDPTASSRSEIVMPPDQWSASSKSAARVLEMANALFTAGLADPTPLTDVIKSATAVATNTGTASTQLTPDKTTIPASLRDQARTQSAQIDAFTSALVADPGSTLTPQSFGAPLREDLARALHYSDDTASSRPVATTRMAASQAEMRNLGTSVSLLNPHVSYTLASNKSPLPLVAENKLPLPIRVYVRTVTPPGVEVDDVGMQQLPARGTRQIQLPTQVKASRSVIVDATLVTASGVELGHQVHMNIRSNAYGLPVFVITVAAGILLVLLAGRRLWRRFRGRPDPADHNRPEPDAREKAAAESVSLHRGPTPMQREHTTGQYTPPKDTGAGSPGKDPMHDTDMSRPPGPTGGSRA